jgi:hypothetical protein
LSSVLRQYRWNLVTRVGPAEIPRRVRAPNLNMSQFKLGCPGRMARECPSEQENPSLSLHYAKNGQSGPNITARRPLLVWNKKEKIRSRATGESHHPDGAPSQTTGEGGWVVTSAPRLVPRHQSRERPDAIYVVPDIRRSACQWPESAVSQPVSVVCQQTPDDFGRAIEPGRDFHRARRNADPMAGPAATK